MWWICGAFLIINVINVSMGFPSETQSLIIPSIRTKRDGRAEGFGGQRNAKIKSMKISTHVSNRFAQTEVVSQVKNTAHYPQEVMFSAILPDNAYISGFIMEVAGSSYEAVVEEKEVARQLFNQAISTGENAGHVEMGARDSNQFKVSVNVEARMEVTFRLKYDELMTRKRDKYEIVLNIFTGTCIDDLQVKVTVNETVPLLFIGAPKLRDGNTLTGNNRITYHAPNIDLHDKYCATVTYNPTRDDQYYIAQRMGTSGFAVQFIVQYDIERYPIGEPALISTADDHFVYFFSPNTLLPLPKHVIFVLDTSGSMEGFKLTKLKETMKEIVTKLDADVVFSIIEFSNNIGIWNIPLETKLVLQDNFEENLKTQPIPEEVTATRDNIQHAKNVIDRLHSQSTTNIMDTLQTALTIASKRRKNRDDIRESIIIFLTDGEPNEGLQEPAEILNKVTTLNSGEDRSTIFTLSFGDDADEEFLENLALQNYGTTTHIYDGADVNIQLLHFFYDIASPLLTAVQFEYDTESVGDITNTEFPTYFSGREIVIAGQLTNKKEFAPVVRAKGKTSPYVYTPGRKVVNVGLERLFVFLSIKQKIATMKISQNKTALRQEILDKAVKYSYVTPVTSLVVVKPNDVKSDAPLEDVSRKVFATPTRTTTTTTSTPSPNTNWNTYMITNHISSFDFGNIEEMEAPPGAVEAMKQQLPWLQDLLKDDQSMLIAGGWYDLGLWKYLEERYICMNSRNHTVGQCQYIDSCLHFARELKTSIEFEQHFCPLNDYAGICCPNE